jgi:hypothetical protein
MTLAEKIGQMVQIEREVATPDVMTKYFIGKLSSNVGLIDSLLCNFLIQFISLFINVDRVPILRNLAIHFINVLLWVLQEVCLVVVGVCRPQKHQPKPG